MTCPTKKLMNIEQTNIKLKKLGIAGYVLKTALFFYGYIVFKFYFWEWGWASKFDYTLFSITDFAALLIVVIIGILLRRIGNLIEITLKENISLGELQYTLFEEDKISKPIN
ncbi:MAG: hypothetical protein JJU02_10640 [Cryomorphaceae bacterium]|nr:hypothetical protein [Cryomorphaceae bacterium]